MSAVATRAGSDAVRHVFVMENHDEAYSAWRTADVKQRILIHIDAHHDMWWVPDHVPTTIASFICPGLREEMVREIFWVVPDQTWELPASRKAVLRHLKEITAKYPQSQRATQVGARCISTVIMGKPMTVCSVDGLPTIEEDVLLDIDIDYLVIPYVSHGGGDTHGPLPWRWPDELLALLDDREIRSDFATIAYSVEGGYTPLKWKYLGNELAERLRGADPIGALLSSMSLIRDGAIATFRGEFAVAEEKYLEAIKLAPDSAACYYHLAQLFLDMNRLTEARDCYQRAVAIDPSYRTAFNTAGLLYQSEGYFKQAEREIKRALLLDPEDAYGHYGLGQLAGKRKEWAKAEESLKRSIACDDQLIDAHRALGDLLTRQGRHDEAIGAYESSMKLALAGQVPLDGPIITNGSAQSLHDPDHCRVHARLAYLRELKGETERAITGYRISIAGGYGPPAVRTRLAYLYFKRGQWQQSTRQLWQALEATPGALRRIFVHVYRKLRRITSSTYRSVVPSPARSQ